MLTEQDFGGKFVRVSSLQEIANSRKKWIEK